MPWPLGHSDPLVPWSDPKIIGVLQLPISFKKKLLYLNFKTTFNGSFKPEHWKFSVKKSHIWKGKSNLFSTSKWIFAQHLTCLSLSLNWYKFPLSKQTSFSMTIHVHKLYLRGKKSKCLQVGKLNSWQSWSGEENCEQLFYDRHQTPRTTLKHEITSVK